MSLTGTTFNESLELATRELVFCFTKPSIFPVSLLHSLPRLTTA